MVKPHRLPPLRALQVFEAVGRLEGINKAAEELGISSGAVSQQIKLLEERLGVTLLDRSEKRIRLTQAAKSYHSLLTQGFSLLENAHSVLRISTENQGLNISSLPSILIKWLAPRIVQWEEKYPDSAVRLHTSFLEPDLLSEGVNFRITFGAAADQHPYKKKLFHDTALPVCSPGLLEKLGGIATPNDILSLPFLNIDWRPEFENSITWEGWFKSQGINLDPIPITTTYSLSSVAIEAALGSRGVCLTQYSFVYDDLKAGRLVVPYNHGMVLKEAYYLAWHEATFDQPDAKQFAQWITTTVKEFNNPDGLHA